MPKNCSVCKEELFILDDKVGRLDACPHCNVDLHACNQCRFYSPGRHNDCAEPRSDPVPEKTMSNFCDWFELGGPGETTDDAAAARKALERLFKK